MSCPSKGILSFWAVFFPSGGVSCLPGGILASWFRRGGVHRRQRVYVRFDLWLLRQRDEGVFLELQQKAATRTNGPGAPTVPPRFVLPVWGRSGEPQIAGGPNHQSGRRTHVRGCETIRRGVVRRALPCRVAAKGPARPGFAPERNSRRFRERRARPSKTRRR